MYRIVSDSSCDIIKDYNGHFASVPMLMYTDDYKYLDDGNTPVTELLNVLEHHNGRSYTACPGPQDWADACGDADEVYIVTITSGLSGAHNSAVSGQAMYLESHPNAKVAVFDSFSTGPEMRMAIEKIDEMKAAGASFEEVAAYIPIYLEKTHLLFVLQSLHNLAQNGRVNKVIASAAGILGISMLGIASPEGTIHQVGKARGDKKIVSNLLKFMKDYNFSGGKVAISHVQNEPLAKMIETAVLKEYPAASVSIKPCTGLCSYYAERNGILLGFECE